MQRTARVCYIYIGAYSFEALTRSMRNEICYAQNTRLDGFMTSLFFLSIPAMQLFLYFLSFYRYRKKNAFFVCYMCPYTHESRTAHFSSDGLRVFCQTIRVQLNMKMLQSFLLLSKTPNSSWVVFFPFMSVSFSL